MFDHALGTFKNRGPAPAGGNELFPFQTERPSRGPSLTSEKNAYRYYDPAERMSDMRSLAFEHTRQNVEAKIWGAPVAVQSPSPARKSGPVRFVETLLDTWGLEPDDAVPLLGFESSEGGHVRAILDGRQPLVGRDIKYRIACLLVIRSTLFGLFRDEAVENEWLREPHPALDDRTPMALLLEGAMENLLIVKEYVEEVAGL